MTASARLKTRLAPTPSGFLHLGNAFNFITTALIAGLQQADILLRVDDMDQARYRPEYAKDIFDTLRFLEIEYSEGPRNTEELAQKWSQQYQLPRYEEALTKLRREDKLFACTCSRKDILQNSPDGRYPGTCKNKGLPLDNPRVTWRLYTDPAAEVEISNWGGEASQRRKLPPDMQYMVVRRRDGLPAYQLSSVLDDLHYRVSLVVRGEDLYRSTLAQLYLAKELRIDAFGSIRFYHHPLLTSASGEKLSKSVQQNPRRLEEEYSHHQIYRRYSQFIGLSVEYDSLKPLMEAISSKDLKNHSSLTASGS